MVFTLCKYNSGLQYIKFINYVFIKSLLHRINVMLHHLFMGYLRDWCFGKDLSLCLSTYGFIRLLHSLVLLLGVIGDLYMFIVWIGRLLQGFAGLVIFFRYDRIRLFCCTPYEFSMCFLRS